MVSVKEAIEMIDTERKKIWTEEPSLELTKALSVPGTFGNHYATLMYLETDTRGIMDHFYCFNQVSLEDDVDLRTLSTLASDAIGFFRFRWDGGEHWFRSGSAPYRVLTATIEALKEVNSKEEFRALISSLALYIGRINWYVDAKIPWAEFAKYFEECIFPTNLEWIEEWDAGPLLC